MRDLQYRRRRFLIAVLATSVVFAMTLIMAGLSKGLDEETKRVVASFDADAWVVARGASGPFTATKFVSDDDVAAVQRADGVRAAAPMIAAHATVGTTNLKDVNLIGFQPKSVGAPPISEGRSPTKKGEVAVDDHLDADVGDTIVVSGRPERVVAKVGDLRYNFGVNTVFITLRDAQSLSFAGQPLASAVITSGTPRGDLSGLRALTNSQVAADLQRPTESGKSTIDIIQALLWIVAGGIIALIVYLTALERVRDFAVLKATGTANRTLFGAMAFQAVVLSIAAAVLAIVIAFVLKPFFPFQIVLSSSAFVLLGGVSVVVGLLASLAGLRARSASTPRSRSEPRDARAAHQGPHDGVLERRVQAASDRLVRPRGEHR